MELVTGRSQQLFTRAIHLWTTVFILWSLPLIDQLWLHPVSPKLSFPFGPVQWLMGLSDQLPLWCWWGMPFALILLSLYSAFRRRSAWISTMIWVLYVVLVSRGWMIGTGGQQLVAILLLWSIPLSSNLSSAGGMKQFASWALRLQLVLVYISTFLHKLQGSDWLDGSAIHVLSSDPTFHFAWLADLPFVAMMLTYAALAFQIIIPVAIWFRATRLWVLLLGVVFHLGSALAIEIPDMALAFICLYLIWLDPDIFARVESLRGRSRAENKLTDVDP